jgi:hypothetical protein
LGGWRATLPAFVLLSVAAVQIWLSRTHALTPWAGAGFGMFATTDVRGSRHLHAFAIQPGVRRELALPEAARDRVRRALAFPSRRALERLAHALAEPADPVWGRPDAVEIQIWLTRFDPVTLAPSARLLRALEVDLEPG